MFQAHIECDLRDLVDAGIDDALDQLKGEAGATGITVGWCTSTRRALRAGRTMHPRIVRSEGGAQFQPEPRYYAAARVRPVVAAWLRKANPLEQVAEACRKRGLDLRARLVACNCPAVAAKHAAAMIKDVFGEPREDWICPLNLDVREYLRGMCEEISAQGWASAVILASVGFPPSPEPFMLGAQPGPVEDLLRNLCFCESCRQLAGRAGIDVVGASRSAELVLEGFLSGGGILSEDPVSFLERHPPLADFAAWRSSEVTELIRTCRTVLRVPMIVEPGTNPLLAGPDPRTAPGEVDALLVRPASLDACDLAEAIGNFRQPNGVPSSVELRLSACTPPCPDAAALVRATSWAAREGIRNVEIGDFGLLPPSRFDWIRQAVRYARRESA